MPLFSIIMPCFNAQDTLVATLKSILHQDDRDWELLCIDDQSDDNTPRILATYAKLDHRIRVLSPTKGGPSAARNLGAEEARGDILCFCDADDEWVPSKLSQLRTAFGNRRVDAVFGQVLFFHHQGKAEARSTVPAVPLTIDMLLGENPVCTMSNVSVRRHVFASSGAFNPRLVHNEDLEWLVRLVGAGKAVVGINQPHVWYRTSDGGLSADLAAMAASRRYVLAVARQLGHVPTRGQEAIYARYLARRALRLDLGRALALRLAMRGLWQNPIAFLFPLRRGAATALGAICAPFLPRRARRALFSHSNG